MTSSIFSRFVAIALLVLCASSLFSQPLEVRGTYFYTPDASPFFWCADIHWDLFNTLDREQTLQYLDDRASKGFNVIQTSFLPPNPAGPMENAYGDQPVLRDSSFKALSTPGRRFDDPESYDYWDHIQWVVEEASKRGLLIAAVPVWGEYIAARSGEPWLDTPQNGYAFGFWLGKRYGILNSDIVWILGGFRMPDECVLGVEIWSALAEGITDGITGVESFNGDAAYDKTIMTYLGGESSSRWFQNAAWLDFHMWATNEPVLNNQRAIQNALQDQVYPNQKPTLNAAPLYEKQTIETRDGLTAVSEIDIRQSAYWSVLSGAGGYAYGCEPIAMGEVENYYPGANNFTSKASAFGATGARQMIHLKKLMESRPFHTAHAAPEILAANPYDPAGYLVSMMGEGFAMVYVPTGKEILIDRDALPFENIRAWWFDPRIGIALDAGSACRSINAGNCLFNPPGEPSRGNDWILILDDERMPFGSPGQQTD